METTVIGYTGYILGSYLVYSSLCTGQPDMADDLEQHAHKLGVLACQVGLTKARFISRGTAS